MSWFTRMLERSPEPRPMAARVVEAAGSTGTGADPTAEPGWRRLTGAGATVNERDLSPMAQARMQRLAEGMWQSNLLANRLIELPLAYLLAEGVTLQSANEDHQAALTAFWNDSINNWPVKLEQRVRALALLGEQCYVCNVGAGGMVRLGYLDPRNIATVVTDPDNVEQAIGVVTRPDARRRVYKYRVVVLGDDAALFSERTQRIRAEGFTDGECLLYQLNKLPSGSRGRSDLLGQFDWLDAYDDFLFREIDRSDYLRTFAWDVTMKGADPAAVEAYAQKFQPPGPNGKFVHNDQIDLKAVTPDLKAADTTAVARLLRNHVLGGGTMPAHWFGGGEDVNRACHSDDTEVLTADGWRGWQQVAQDTRIACYDPQTERLIYAPAGPVHVYDYDGEMVRFHNKMVDVLVTPEHRMWLKRERNREDAQAYEWVAAGGVTANRWWALTGATVDAPRMKTFELPACPTGTSRAIYPALKLPADLWFEFLGWWLSEGFAGKYDGGYVVNLCQKKEPQATRMRHCLQRMTDIRWRESIDKRGTRRWVVCDKGLCTWLRAHCGVDSHERCMPFDPLAINQAQARILFDALMAGDGTVDSRSGRRNGAYFTASRTLADQVQTLAMRLGHRAKIVDTYASARAWRVSITFDCAESIIGKEGVTLEPYRGKVFCFTTPTGAFVTRRNGKIAIHGNSASEMGEPTFKIYTKRQTYLRMMLEEIGRYVIWKASLQAQPLDWSDDDNLVQCVFPELAGRDVTKFAAALQQVATAAVTLTDQGLLTQETALNIVGDVAQRFGQEIDAKTELEAARAERAARRAADATGDVAGLEDALKRAANGTTPPQAE